MFTRTRGGANAKLRTLRFDCEVLTTRPLCSVSLRFAACFPSLCPQQTLFALASHGCRSAGSCQVGRQKGDAQHHAAHHSKGGGRILRLPARGALFPLELSGSCLLAPPPSRSALPLLPPRSLQLIHCFLRRMSLPVFIRIHCFASRRLRRTSSLSMLSSVRIGMPRFFVLASSTVSSAFFLAGPVVSLTCFRAIHVLFRVDDAPARRRRRAVC